MFRKILRLSTILITISPALLISCNSKPQPSIEHIRVFDINEIYLHRGYIGDKIAYPTSWTVENILNSFDLNEDNTYTWNFDDFELTEYEKTLTNNALKLHLDFYNYFSETWSIYWFNGLKSDVETEVANGGLSNDNGFYDPFIYSSSFEEYTNNYPEDFFNVFFKKLKNTKSIHIRDTWNVINIDLHTQGNELIVEEVIIHETEKLNDYYLRASSSLVEVNLPGAKKVSFESVHQVNSIEISEGAESLRIGVKQSWTSEITKDFFPASLRHVRSLLFGNDVSLKRVSFPDNITVFSANALYYPLELIYLELPIDFEYEINAFNRCVLNDENSTIVLPRKYNSDYHKNRLFGAGNWDKINFVEK